jgi:hypothetical protein
VDVDRPAARHSCSRKRELLILRELKSLDESMAIDEHRASNFRHDDVYARSTDDAKARLLH